jgi:hypothetical protein
VTLASDARLAIGTGLVALATMLLAGLEVEAGLATAVLAGGAGSGLGVLGLGGLGGLLVVLWLGGIVVVVFWLLMMVIGRSGGFVALIMTVMSGERE